MNGATIKYSIYSCNNDDTERYLLGNNGEPWIATIGLNCSTATAYKADPTVHKSEKVCKRSGFRGWYMLNLYPLRCTQVSGLPKEADPQAYRRNMDHIIEIFQKHPGLPVWCAWGAPILTRRYFIDAAIDVIKASLKYGAKLRHFGPLTAQGHPRHPSRLSYSWLWGDLDAEKYLMLLKSL